MKSSGVTLKRDSQASVRFYSLLPPRDSKGFLGFWDVVIVCVLLAALQVENVTQHWDALIKDFLAGKDISSEMYLTVPLEACCDKYTSERIKQVQTAFGLPEDGHVCNVLHAGEIRYAIGKLATMKPFKGSQSRWNLGSHLMHVLVFSVSSFGKDAALDMAAGRAQQVLLICIAMFADTALWSNAALLASQLTSYKS